MIRKYIFSLVICLFSVVTLGSGIYIICNDVNSSISSVREGSSQPELDENKSLNENNENLGENSDNPDENMDNLGRSVDVEINATTYEVTYYYINSNGSLAKQTFYNNMNQTYTYYTPTASSLYSLNGWEFIGWRDLSWEEIFYVQYTPGDTYTNADLEFEFTTSDNYRCVFAALYRRTCTLNYNGNGATGGSVASQSYSYQYYSNGVGSANCPQVSNVSFTTRANGFTRTGYTWSSWCLKDNNSMKNYSENQAVDHLFGLHTDSNVQTLYAQWTSNKSSITAHGNGGTLRISEDAVSINSVSSRSNWVGHNPIYQSYDFTKQSNGSYSVSYEATKDTNGNYTKYIMQGSTFATINVTAPINAVIPIDVTFIWKGAKLGSGEYATISMGTTSYSLSSGTRTYTFTKTSSSSIFIRFGKLAIKPVHVDTIIKSFNVSFKIQGSSSNIGGVEWQGDNYSKTKEISYNENYGNFPEATRAGYTFAGWWTAVKGGTQVTSSTVYQSSGGVSIYAHWTPINYTLNYSANGGSVSATSLNYTIEDEISFLVATRNAYSFSGWKPSSAVGNWSTSTVYGGKQIGLYGNVTLVAQYTPINYTITYNPNGGTVSVTSESYNYETYIYLPTPERDGYTFSHWSVNRSVGNWETGVKYTDSLTGKYENVTLVAQWIPISYKVTINSFLSSNTDGSLSYNTGLGQTYKIKTYGGTGSGTTYLISSSVQQITINAEIGTNLEIDYSEISPNAYLYMGRCAGTTNTNTSNPSSYVISMGYSNGAISVFFARSSANMLKYTTENGGYFYFEDGVYPQSEVTGVATSGTASGRTYNIAGTNYAGYFVPGQEQEYVCVNSTVFKVEPIRWRVSDYGVSSTAYPSGFGAYGSFNSSFTAVTDKVLSVGSVMTKTDYNNTLWENWSLTNELSKLPSYANNISVKYAKSVTQAYDKFGGAGSISVVSGTSTSASSNVRIASKTDLVNASLTNYDARATDLVKYLLNCGTYASYWTTNLGSQYGAGQVMTTGNLTKDKWLYENSGLRFAITFNESVRQM